MDFVTKSFRKDETLTSWTVLQRIICPHIWVWLLFYSAITPKSEDKYVVKVFRGSSFEISCYKIHTLFVDWFLIAILHRDLRNDFFLSGHIFFFHILFGLLFLFWTFPFCTNRDLILDFFQVFFVLLHLFLSTRHILSRNFESIWADIGKMKVIICTYHQDLWGIHICKGKLIFLNLHNTFYCYL